MLTLPTPALADSETSNSRISGIVYDDSNGNGIVETGEEGLAGVTVFLSGEKKKSAVTDLDGRYLFQGLPAGAYQITEVDLPGYASTTANTVSLTVAPADVRDDVDFGDAIPLTLFGAVFQDDDLDGQLDFTEYGVREVSVSLYKDTDGDGVFDAGDTLRASTRTDFDGNFRFLNQLPGQILAIDHTPAGYLTTTPTVVPLTLLSGASGGLEVNFGIVPAAEILGLAWHDANGDEEVDTGETGLSDLLVTLYQDANGNGLVDTGDVALTSVTTGEQGQFVLTDLYPGAYLVDVDDHSIPLGTLSTTNNDPADLVLEAGQGADVLFGYYQPASSKVGTVGFWKREYRQLGNPIYTAAELANIVVQIDLRSAVFSEIDGVSDALLRNGRKTTRERATQQLAALWSNVASGKLEAEETVDLGSLSSATTVLTATLEADGILADPLASEDEQERAKAIADKLNR